MSKPLRLSPSGPIVSNAAGAPFAPGPGARLRLTEATATSLSTNVIPTVPGVLNVSIGTPGFQVSLSAPDPHLQYRATALCDVSNPTTNQSFSIELYCDMSPDGVTWTQVASNQHTVAAATSRQIRLDLPLQAGSGIGVVAGQAALNLRCRIGASSGGTVALVSGGLAPGAGPQEGASLIQLEETF